MGLIIGADIGGTSTKIAVTDVDGTLLAYATGPGGNIRSARGDVAANIATTLERALVGLPRAQVRATHLGIAGAGPARHKDIDALCRTIWRDSAVPGHLTVESDLEIAFASAATGREGLLLLAGTGAVSCHVRDLAMVSRCDGMGWLLGDVGSAVWFGLRALEATASDLDHRGPRTTLTDAVLMHLEVTERDDPRQALIAAVYPLAIADHGQLAPLVIACSSDGDLVAEQIVDAGVAGLLATARGALTGGPGANGSRGPAVPEVVLAGSLLTSQGPVRTRVVERLAAELDLTPAQVRDSRAPVVGAIRLAVRQLTETTIDLPALTEAVLKRA